MRRLSLLLASLLISAAPASASAAITPTDDPVTLAGAIAGNQGAGASFAERPPTGNVVPYAFVDSLLAGFPTTMEGSFAVLTNGDAAQVAGAAVDPQSEDASNDLGGAASHGFAGATGNAYDTSALRIPFTADGAGCLSFNYRFLSEEFPEYVGENVSDGFVAEVDGSTLATDDNGDVAAPNNFAFDSTGALVSVNTASFSAANGAGTAYDGATDTLTARTPVTSGSHTLYLTIFDQGDNILDSAVFVDNLTLTSAGGCTTRPDATPPAVTVTVPASGSTVGSPVVLSGQAGAAETDSGSVTLQIYGGASIAGTPVDVESTTRVGAGWQVEVVLEPGQYTAQAHQTDNAGNIGVSSTRTFTVVAAVEPPPSEPDPPDEPDEPDAADPVPVLGKSVVASVVSGRVRIKGKNGKFRTLRGDEAIPLGSTVDATKGRVRITSAAGGGKTQAGDFYQGVFVITQTRGAKPITQLALAGKLSCAKKGKKATASAKKKKIRRLWGDGKGRFRTRGKHGAATVRGTKWLTEDRCKSTKVTVKRGSVVVRDFVKRKNKVVRKGQSYVARAK